ncbi:Adenylate kinase [Pseudosulfitobacter pseudonitzschiae]|uniref:Adenylate kinase n=1 Tax=Pseudosulfitobacter pseudonitzschiae TaxID=1402135 RepID=A0A073J8F5_9RHOB|nr:adenylate kinase [Pseudosulfitobacter pseudonitzschiae]KEJ98239.1 adenylate kinase [Pseudosulfitobacter pseudonitzschiae]QKS09471.1 adenylate kinase [Pseudosulfitobacter pseudonitzschiae]SHE41920.1 Adenylate kinase [Pseudosulfitobacter pseudonitzschiae]
MAQSSRLYILGASCSGVSTLGQSLSAHLGVPQLDVDSFYWLPTDPPYTTKRAPEDRVQMIRAEQARTQGWILSGSFIGWGETLVEDVDMIIYVHTPTQVRMQRLDAREAQRHGARILPGGDMHLAHLAFRKWASQYDDPAFSGRNRAQHERWLDTLSVPVLRLDGTHDKAALLDAVARELSSVRA